MNRASTRLRIILLSLAVVAAAAIAVGLYYYSLSALREDKPSPGEPGSISELNDSVNRLEESPYAKVTTAVNGNMVAEIFSQPVRFRDKEGAWRDIDTALAANGSKLEPKATDFGLEFGSAYKSPVTISIGGARVSFTPAAAANTRALVDGDTAVYKGVYAHTDLERVALAEGVKETYILTKKGHPAVFETVVKTGLTLKEEKDGSIGYYSGSRLVAVSPTPDLVDKKGRRLNAAFSLSKGRIRLSLPKDLAGLEYPLRVDPTTYIVSDASDGYLGFDVYGGSNGGSSISQILEVSVDSEGGRKDSWLKFPLTGINGPIISATFNIYYSSHILNEGTMYIYTDHVPDFGVLDEADMYTPALAWNIDPAPITETTPLGWHSVDVTSRVQDDLSNFRSASAYRMGMSAWGAWYAGFNSSEAPGNKPYLRIVYTADEAEPRTEIEDPVDLDCLAGDSYLITGTASPRLGGSAVSLVEVSTDGGANWSAAAGTDSWTYAWTLPGAGDHIIRTRATDSDGIVETPGPGIRVTVDDSPPIASITAPAPGQTISGAAPIVGTADDPYFDSYIIEFGKGNPPADWIQLGEKQTTAVGAGTLATINTLRLENEGYSFRLTVFDKAGNSSQTSVAVNVNNGPRPGSPHGNYQLDSDLCALCHGTHTSIFAPGLLRFGAVAFQSQLCYTCHNGTGSSYNIQQKFDEFGNQAGGSHHPIMDTVYGGDAEHTLQCSDCHDPHGSEEVDGHSYPRILRTKDKGGAKHYSGNNVCYSCHGEDGEIKDMRAFETNNAHNNTDPDQTSQFPEPGSGTKIKCSQCHEAHGSIEPRLRITSDKQLCGTCHPDTPYTLRTDNEVVTSLGYPDGRSEPCYAGVRVFSQDTFNPPPVALKGPKEFRVPWQNFSPADIGMAIGDATNDGRADVVETVGYSSTLLAVFAQDSNGRGLKAPTLFSGRGGFGVAIGDVIGNDGLQEVVIADVQLTNRIKVLTIMGETIVSSTQIASGGTEPRGVAIGDIDSDGDNDVVVANINSNSISVFKQAAGILSLSQTIGSGGSRPLDVAIGDVDNDGDNEVVVVNTYYAWSGNPPYTEDNIAVFNHGGGGLVLSATFSNGTATQGYDVAIGDVLSGRAGNEIVVAGHPMYPSGYTVQGDLTVINIPTGTQYTTSTGGLDSKGVATGDVDGDGTADVAVLNAESVAIFKNGNTALAGPVIYEMRGPNTIGGYETGIIAIGDIGNLHPYGHRSETLGDSCSGVCHDPHAVTKAAPWGGVSGVEPVYGSPTTYTTVANAVKDYQLCYKCHSGAASPMVGSRDIAAELNPNNPSYHAVMAAGRRTDMPAGSFVSPWNQTSRLKCDDCHDQAVSGPQIVHGSSNSHGLKSQYDGVKMVNSSLFCYSCHAYSFYYPSSYTAPPRFTWDSALSSGSHAGHTRRGYGCPTCHEVHGSSSFPGMMRPDMRWEPGTRPGTSTCAMGCHSRY